jgi:trk system potassium uptake protein TrkH
MKKSIFGSLLLMEGVFLILTIAVSLFYGEGDTYAFLLTAILCYAIGGLCKWAGRNSRQQRMTRTDNFLVVSLSWVMFSVIGMIPFMIVHHMDLTDAFFETMSGFSTTGATCINDIDSMTHALKFWRSTTQWMGGLGIVVFTIALIPSYEMKNTSIFSAEVPGVEVDKLRPKIASTARRLLLIYLLLSFLCALFYWIGPMNFFDAVCHAMTTIATGGFSTHTQSIAYFHSTYLEYVAPTFMLLSGVNFSLYYYLSIRRGKVLLRNEELRTYLWGILVMVAFFMVSFYLAPVPAENLSTLPQGFEDRLRSAYFHVATNMTSTGYSAQYFDYVAWGAAFWMPTVFIMGIGSCAGSTAGGVKVVRVLIALKTAFNEFVHQLHPRAVLSVRVNGQIIPNQLVRRTLSFIIIYTFLVVFGMVFFTYIGIDVDTAMGSCISMLSNVGPGTGMVGPASNFAHIPAPGKWLMSFYMLVGRLEIYTVLFLFLPGYWKERK